MTYKTRVIYTMMASLKNDRIIKNKSHLHKANAGHTVNTINVTRSYTQRRRTGR